MRLRFVLALVCVVATIATASCGEGGDGTGTSPELPPACPKTSAELTNPCPALNVCDFPTEQKVAVCPFANGTWDVQQKGEAGVFADAVVPEVSVDAAAEVSDALDDATEAGETSDALLDLGVDVLPDVELIDAPSDG